METPLVHSTWLPYERDLLIYWCLWILHVHLQHPLRASLASFTANSGIVCKAGLFLLYALWSTQAGLLIHQHLLWKMNYCYEHYHTASHIYYYYHLTVIIVGLIIKNEIKRSLLISLFLSLNLYVKNWLPISDTIYWGLTDHFCHFTTISGKG